MITDHIIRVYRQGSGIRTMFETAQEFKRGGKDPIDLSLGNPAIKPPIKYYATLVSCVLKSILSLGNHHAYIPNAGLPETRERVASDVSTQLSMRIPFENVFMTSGAANALDGLLATLLEPGNDDEVIILAPYFPDYPNFIRNNRGIPVEVSMGVDFLPDLEAIERAVRPKTKAIIVNSPNNPTGLVYPEEHLHGLAELLNRKSREYGSPIACIEDTPYDKIVFRRTRVHSMMDVYPHTFHVNSFSKSLSIAGERLGYIVAHPEFLATADHRKMFLDVLKFNLRTRVVNAPALQQRVIAKIGCNVTCDISEYEKRVQTLTSALSNCGFTFPTPQGAFYVFAQLPEQFADAASFRQRAFAGNEPLIYAPGKAFGTAYERHVRFSACASARNIDRASEKLRRICT